MSALANNFDCSECQQLTSRVAEIQAQIVEARAELQQAIEAADGTSARKYNELEQLLRAEGQIASKIQVHDRIGHSGYVADVAEDTLTHDTIET